MLKEFEFTIFRKKNIKYQYFRNFFLYSFQINLVQYILQVVLFLDFTLKSLLNQ